jgi:hypothetical protein
MAERRVVNICGFGIYSKKRWLTSLVMEVEMVQGNSQNDEESKDERPNEPPPATLDFLQCSEDPPPANSDAILRMLILRETEESTKEDE